MLETIQMIKRMEENCNSLSTLLLTVNLSNFHLKCLGSIRVLMSLQIYAERLNLCVPNLKAICFQEISRLYESCLFFCAVEARKKVVYLLKSL